MSHYTALLDANILYPAPMRDVVMQLAVTDIFKAKWSEDVHREWMESLMRNQPHRYRAALERTRDLMNEATRGKWRTVDVLACPVTWRPHPEQIASARRGYDDWWQALDWVRDGLKAGRILRDMEVTAAMPKARPWL